MEVSRRQFIQIGGAAAASTAVPAWAAAERPARPTVRWAAKVAADMPEPDIHALLLARAAFGARPGDIDHARAIGADAWIEEQLSFDPASLDTDPNELLIRAKLPTLTQTTAEILGDRNEQGNIVSEAPREILLATVYRQVFGPGLLHEVMAEFWSDHFSVYLSDGQVRYLKTADDRALRPLALSDFKVLLRANAESPCMLNYLNNDQSTARAPNENYAREIMELHTLGSADEDGYPYSEADVFNAALCLTGWSWDRRSNPPTPTWGEFQFVRGQHAQGEKRLFEHLGHLARVDDPGQSLMTYIPSGQLGQADGEQLIDVLTHHPACPPFLAEKLVRRFVTDDPMGQTPDLVDRVAQAYIRSDGDVKEMLSEILRSPEFVQSFATFGGRMSRPVDFVTRALRVLGAPSDVVVQPVRDGNRFTAAYNFFFGRGGYLPSMGHIPFDWATPDGFPDVKASWTATSSMLSRWNYGLDVASGGLGFQPATQTPAELSAAGEITDYWIDRLLLRPMLDADRATAIDYLTQGGDDTTPVRGTQLEGRVPYLIALILDSPYFQWR